MKESKKAAVRMLLLVLLVLLVLFVLFVLLVFLLLLLTFPSLSPVCGRQQGQKPGTNDAAPVGALIGAPIGARVGAPAAAALADWLLHFKSEKLDEKSGGKLSAGKSRFGRKKKGGGKEDAEEEEEAKFKFTLRTRLGEKVRPQETLHGL